MKEPRVFYDEQVLAARWGLSRRTLQQWRARGRGPAWVKLGSAVRYAETTVERYEQEHLINPFTHSTA